MSVVEEGRVPKEGVLVLADALMEADVFVPLEPLTQFIIGEFP